MLKQITEYPQDINKFLEENQGKICVQSVSALNLPAGLKCCLVYSEEKSDKKFHLGVRTPENYSSNLFAGNGSKVCCISPYVFKKHLRYAVVFEKQCESQNVDEPKKEKLDHQSEQEASEKKDEGKGKRKRKKQGDD